jgi:hypothetical protein
MDRAHVLPDPGYPVRCPVTISSCLLTYCRIDNQSLYMVVLIELDLQAKTDAVEEPLNAIVRVPFEAPLILLGHKQTFWCRIVLWDHVSPRQAHKRNASRHT